MGRPRTVAREIDPIVRALRIERMHQGLSQEELAQRMGLVSRGSISEHERGVNQPGLPLLRDWAAALGCRIVLVTRKEN